MPRIDDVFERTARRSRTRPPRDRETPHSRRRWRWWIPLLLCGILAVAFGPRLASFPLCRDWIVQRATADVEGQVSVAGLSVGWLSGIRLSGVQLSDTHGAPIVQIDEVRIPRGLLSLLVARDVGEITVHKPQLHWVADTNTSNLETALAKYLQPSTPPSSSPVPSVAVQIIDGHGDLAVRGESPALHLEKLGGRISVDSQQGQLQLEIESSLIDAAGNVGELRVRGNAALSAASGLGPGNLDLIAQKVPAAGLVPLLHRCGEDLQLAGGLGAEIHLGWTESFADLARGEVEVQVNRLTAEKLVLAGARRLQGDRLQVNHLQASGKILQRGATTRVHELRAESEFARIEAHGQFDWPALAAAIAGQQLPPDDFNVAGQVDLAQVLRMLPHSIPLQADVELQRAELAFTSFNRLEGTNRRWLIDAEAKNIEAQQGGRAIQWNRPARLSAAWIQDSGAPRLESLRCETSSVVIHGGSDLWTGKVETTGDLEALLSDVRQIMPLTGYELAGKFQGNFQWSSRAIDQIAADRWPVEMTGSLRCENLVVRLPGWERFVEPQSELTLRAAGTATRQGPQRLDSGELHYQAGTDRFSLHLSEPVEPPSWSARWPGQIELSGAAATWFARLRPLLPAGAANSTGQVTLQTPVVFFAGILQCSPLQAELRDWTLDWGNLHLREPQVQLAGDLAWDTRSQRLTSRELTLTSATLAVRAVETQAAAGTSGWTLSSAASFRADVNRLQRCSSPQFDELQPQWFGEAEGTARCSSESSTIRGELDVQLKNLVAAQYRANPTPNNVPAGSQPWNILWQEPLARLQSSAELDPSRQALQLQKLSLQSQLVGLEAQGSFSELSTRCIVDIRGTWAPNWEAAVGLLRAYAGQQVELVGSRQPQGFAVRGPLLVPGSSGWVPADLTADASLAWEGGRMYGLPLGPAQLNGTLSQSVFRVQPTTVALSQGSVHLAPIIDLRGDPTLIIEPGTLLDSITLTPEVCRDWMKYIAPIMAEATQAQGKFSLATDGVQFPLLSPQRGSARGRLLIDSASILPGPLGQQLVSLANSVKQLVEGQPLGGLLQPPGSQPASTTESTSLNGTLVDVPQQQIGWELREGQVFHDGLTLNIRGIPVKTSGGIGLDSRLNLLAEVPIQEGWIKKHPFLAGLRGGTLRLPISGTGSQPKIDPNAWGQVLRQWASGTASNELNSQLNDFLNQQLGGKIPGLNTSSATPPPNSTPPANTPTLPFGDSLQQAAEGQLQQGLNKLFGPKK